MRFHVPNLVLYPSPNLAGGNLRVTGGISQPPSAANPVLETEDGQALETEDGRSVLDETGGGHGP